MPIANPTGIGRNFTATGQSLGTSYTNNSGRDEVHILAGLAGVGGPCGFSAVVNGSPAMGYPSAYASSASYGASGFFIIPAGATYTISGSNITLSSWYKSV